MKNHVTLLFPGQGSQYVGMGESSRDEYEIANKVLGYNLKEICVSGPNEELTLTKNAQPAIVTHSVALFRKLKPILDSENISIQRVLGHSVGEYSALVAAGSLKFEDAIRAVHLRGKYMQEAVPKGLGKMYALLKVPQDLIKQACEKASDDEYIVMPANFNEPEQTVISGHAKACEKALAWLEDHFDGRVRAIELNVSAPFHSTLMKRAEEKLSIHLNTIEFAHLTIPYIANIDATEYGIESTPETIKNNLINQVCGSVLWSQSIASLPEETKFIEVGPGKILSGLVKKINKNFKVFHMDQENSRALVTDFLKE